MDQVKNRPVDERHSSYANHRMICLLPSLANRRWIHQGISSYSSGKDSSLSTSVFYRKGHPRVAIWSMILLSISLLLSDCTLLTNPSDYETDDRLDTMLNKFTLEDIQKCVENENNLGNESCRLCRCLDCLNEFIACDEQCWKIVRCTFTQGCLETDNPSACATLRCIQLGQGQAPSANAASTLLNCLASCEDICGK